MKRKRNWGKSPPISIVACDPNMTLRAWETLIDELAEKFGETAILYTDAGYNNVELIIESLEKENKND